MFSGQLQGELQIFRTTGLPPSPARFRPCKNPTFPYHSLYFRGILAKIKAKSQGFFKGARRLFYFLSTILYLGIYFLAISGKPRFLTKLPLRFII
ncbi:hypothetical protein CHY_1036 [Carboxydothermus hydrogenoformans Z-2901]|uniref:Uncharacterized protein n=1 Tax=Carboxydothermus hydrogenoformans (strain ATCC BAA-161 / DSM 6008 / Z-2901) TaxID=246194 RepID=Q3ADA2_CARHZ|nr:hypothetical protein CHY_1036 [Carboxydothermus hydrogenoformans Z-2901]